MKVGEVKKKVLARQQARQNRLNSAVATFLKKMKRDLTADDYEYLRSLLGLVGLRPAEVESSGNR